MSIRLAIISLFWALLSLAASSATAEERPNILLIVSEDNGPELGCYGEPFVQTPNLDRLASQGILFGRAPEQGDLLVFKYKYFAPKPSSIGNMAQHISTTRLPPQKDKKQSENMAQEKQPSVIP